MKKLLVSIVLIMSVLNMHNCFGQSDMKRLTDSLETYIKEKRIPGAMITIVKSDTILFSGGIGYADIEKKEEVSAKHLFRQGSISKSFTALGLYKLLNNSSYSLDSPIKEIDKNLPFKNQWESTFPVRVSHILEHTSGFEDFHLHAVYNVRDHVLPPIIAMVNDHKQSLKSRWKPGDKKAYSNPNYILAGHLIEVLSGRSYNEYVFDSILSPIGMQSSGYYFNKPQNKLFAQGYQRNGTALNPLEFATINGGPAGDFCANAEDMATYLQFMLRRDSLLFTDAEFDRIETPQTSIVAKRGLKVGYGLGNYSIWKNNYLFHGHGGQIDGFTSRYVYSRKADLGVSVAINRNGNANEIVDMILKHILGTQEGTSSERVTYPIPEALKEKFTGFYKFNSPKSKLLAFSDIMFAGLSLKFEEDKITTKKLLGRPAHTLFYAGNNQFYVNDEGLPSAMLLELETDKQVLWINDSYTEKESRIKRLIIFFGLFVSFLFLASFLLHSIFWFSRRLFKKEKSSITNHTILLGAIICFVLMFIGFGFSMDNVKNAQTISFYSLLMYVSSYAFVILSVASVWRWPKLPNKRMFKVYYILTSISAITLSIYLWDIGFIGLRLWSY